MQKVVAVVGPTASGKTGLAIAVGKVFGAEIISADSMQIYREMRIGTARPSLEEQQGIPHYLMGHVSVRENYHVAAYVKDAKAVLSALEKRGVLPIFCGGTGLYLDHLLQNTSFFEIPLQEEVRIHYRNMAEEQGPQYLYEQLNRVDPALAERLHPHDIKRVTRGLEVFASTGKRLSDYQLESHMESPYQVLYLGLNFHDRALLYQRIDQRVDQMVRQGLLDEIEQLRSRCTLSSTARAAIGYKELMDALDTGESLSEAICLVKQKTRNYAKRQLSWFRRNQEIHWLYADEEPFSLLLDRAISLVRNFLSEGTSE